jgi:hypothetical protein
MPAWAPWRRDDLLYTAGPERVAAYPATELSSRWWA